MTRRLGAVAVAAGAAALAVCLGAAAACGEPEPSSDRAPLPPVASSGSAASPNHATTKIVFLGDSLTAGLGLETDQAYPSMIAQQLRRDGYSSVEVVNAGVSGDTSAGGLARLDGLLGPDVRIVVVALGGNDALRGLTPQQTRENLTRIIDAALARGVRVLLAGMEAPTNMGPDYQAAFHQTFVALARAYAGRIEFMPFLLTGVAGDAALNQADGIHPNPAGAQRVAQAMYPQVRRLVDAVSPSGRASQPHAA